MTLRLRHALPVLAVLAVVPAAARCSKGGESPPPDAAADASNLPPTPAAWNQPVTQPDDTTAAASRAACTYVRGDMPAATLGPSMPLDVNLPISTIVVLMLENRSFDSYLGHLNLYGNRTDIESAAPDASNPDPDGGTHPWQHGPHLCFADTDHSWKGAHFEWDNGKNDGFYEENTGQTSPGTTDGLAASLLDGERALYWYDQTDLPFYYSLYNSFAIADHYYSSILGPTYPNRMYLYSGTSFGFTTNGFPDLTPFPYPASQAIIFDELEKRHTSWNIFADGAPGAGVVLATTIVSRYGRDPVLPTAQFLSDAQAGTLPTVSFVDPNLSQEGPGDNDEHPPAQIQVGQHFVWQIVNALTQGPLWPHAVLFITYDENGGEFDHVSPPPACAPDSDPPMLTGTDVGTPGTFAQYGFRVPFVAVSPYAKKSYAGHATYDHTSILRFIEAKTKVPALSSRDANADPFTDLFDWESPPLLVPPSFPEPAVNPTELQYCEQTYPPLGGF
jgi:phospholipase C